MTRREYVLAVLAADGDRMYDPIQMQKLFFLLDRRIPDRVGGPWFDFRPEGFGPFDVQVADELHALAKEGLITLHRGVTQIVNGYHVLPKAVELGQPLLDQWPPAVVEYIRELEVWVRKLAPFELIGHVNYHFPDMAVNTVFQGVR